MKNRSRGKSQGGKRKKELKAYSIIKEEEGGVESKITHRNQPHVGQKTF